MLNRSAVVVRRKQPFFDWLKALDVPDHELPSREEKNLYLVPDYEDPDHAEKILKKVYDEIFCCELEAWFRFEEDWPRDRSFKVFKQWFTFEHFEIVEDVGRVPIENDE